MVNNPTERAREREMEREMEREIYREREIEREFTKRDSSESVLGSLSIEHSSRTWFRDEHLGVRV